MTAPWSAEFVFFMSLNSFMATAATVPKSPITATTMEAIAGSTSYPRKASLREGRTGIDGPSSVLSAANLLAITSGDA